MLTVIAPAAKAGTGTAPDGIGERKAYKFESDRLDDRLELNVNVSTGNLLVKATDLQIAGTGLELGVERFYNSLSTWNEALSPGWLLGTGHDVRLEVTAGGAVFHGPSGYQARFDRDADGNYSAPEPGLDATLTRNADGSFELEWHSKERYLFSSSGRWTEHRDKNDNTIRFAYDGAGHVSTITDTRGRTATFGYTGGRLTTVRDNAAGRTYTYTYDAAGRLASSAVTAYALEKDNRNVGVRTLYGYDASGRLNRITDPRGNATTIAYNGTTRKVRSITRVTEPAAGSGPTTTFSYLTTLDKCDEAEDNAVRETRVDGPRTDVSDVTTHCLDRHDRAVATFDAKGHKRSSTYTSSSNVEDFNESGTAGGASMGFDWSDSGQLNSVRLATGGQSAFGYDDAANNPHFPTSVREFSTGSSSAATWDYDYDDDGNLIEAESSGEGITYLYCYNGNGTVDRIAPPALDGLQPDENGSGSSCAGHSQGNDTLFSYNVKGELTRVDPPGPRGTLTFTYDALSRVKTRTDGRGVTMTVSYDALDRVTRIDWRQPLNTSRVFGELPSGAGVLIPPDDEITPHTWIYYSYDVNGNLIARGDSSGEATFQYDALNRMTKQIPEDAARVTTYSYDPAGNLTVLQAANDDPAPVRYSYDSTNLVESITDQKDRTTTFTYNSQGLRRATRYPNGVVMENRYDDSKRLACTYAYTGTPPSTGPGQESCPSPSTSLLTYYRYSYDRLGTDTNRRETTTERDGSVTSYDYDAISRLESASTRNTAGAVTREHSYRYDAESNLTREQVTGTSAPDETRTQAYDLDGALCWVATGDQAGAGCGATPAGATRYGFNGEGSLTTSSEGLAATYSLRGHTIEVTPPGGVATFMKYTDANQDERVQVGNERIAYSQIGLASRAPVTANSNTTWFVRDPDGDLVAMLTRDAGEPDRYYLFDGLGSVVATTDAAGNLVKRYAYEPYGEEINPSDTDRNPWRYAAGYYDSTTGMLKFGTRYYMPNVGRWTQRDPVIAPALGDPVQLNSYGYVGGDPVNQVDPSGELLPALAALAVSTAIRVGGARVAAYAGARLAGTRIGSSIGTSIARHSHPGQWGYRLWGSKGYFNRGVGRIGASHYSGQYHVAIRSQRAPGVHWQLYP